MSYDEETLHRLLKKYFGWDKFRSVQLKAVQAVLSGKNVFVRSATGSGKSLIWQVCKFIIYNKHLPFELENIVGCSSKSAYDRTTETNGGCLPHESLIIRSSRKTFKLCQKLKSRLVNIDI